MRKLYTTLVVLVSSLTNLYGQDSIPEKNVFNEARFKFFSNTILIFNEYLDVDGGSYNTTDFRFLCPIGNRAWNLRFDLPLVSTNTVEKNKTGLSDIGLSLAFIPVLSNHNGLALRTKFYVPTAIDGAFGTGKWVFNPSVFYGHYFGEEKKFMLITDLEYQISFAGSSNRNDVSTGTFENTLYCFFGKNWLGADIALRYNSTAEVFQNNAYLEFGRKINERDMFYLHPSIGIGKDRSYNYGIEVGFLIQY